MRYQLILACLLVSCFACSWAFGQPTPIPTRPQLNATYTQKLIGMSVRTGCPTPATVQSLTDLGAAMEADYTVIVEPMEASYCPTPWSGLPDWPGSYAITNDPDKSLDVWVNGGLTIGLHYRVSK